MHSLPLGLPRHAHFLHRVLSRDVLGLHGRGNGAGAPQGNVVDVGGDELGGFGEGGGGGGVVGHHV